MLVSESTDSRRGVDVEASHQALRDLGTDAVEALKSLLDEARLGEVDTEDELVDDLVPVLTEHGMLKW